MKIIFSVSHPAHVHLFKNAIWQLTKNKHQVKIVAMKKEINLQLLDAYNLGYEIFGKNVKGFFNKIINVLRLDLKLLPIIKKFNPDLAVSTGSPYMAQVSRMMNVPHITFGDTEIDKIGIIIGTPFTAVECNPSCYMRDMRIKQIKYDGYHELAYLHPKYFTPDENVLNEVCLAKNDKFSICRFVDWSAVHDLGAKGAWAKTLGEKLLILKTLENYSKVFLTTETKDFLKLKKYMMPIQYHKLHDLLAFASLYIGEGATMASEAGVLGVPWIFVSTTKRGYLEDQEKNYGLGWTLTSLEEALEKAKSVLSADREKIKIEWQKKRKRLLSEKIDVTEFIVDFIENWPESFEKYKRSNNNRNKRSL